jgi:hypothetical protein
MAGNPAGKGAALLDIGGSSKAVFLSCLSITPSGRWPQARDKGQLVNAE